VHAHVVNRGVVIFCRLWPQTNGMEIKMYHTTPYELTYVLSPDSVRHEHAYCRNKNYVHPSLQPYN
jgi:hypothetical protein